MIEYDPEAVLDPSSGETRYRCAHGGDHEHLSLAILCEGLECTPATGALEDAPERSELDDA